jgi:hypothetical protein
MWPRGFDYRAYPEATVLAGFEPDGSVRWRRDDITIPVGEGRVLGRERRRGDRRILRHPGDHRGPGLRRLP